MSFSISFVAQTQRNIKVAAADVSWSENSSYRMHWLLTANGSDVSEGWVGYSESSVYMFDFGKSYYEPGQYQVTARLYEGTTFIELQRESFEFPCTVTIYANDGSGDSQEETVSYGAAYTIPECPFSVPSGKTFAGYAGTATATTAQWQPGQTTTVNVDRDFYCIWADIPVETYTITYDANGGYGAPPQQTVDGLYIIISDTIPTRNGYTFAGWMGVGATSGQEVWRQPGQALGNITEDYTFTAEWYVYAITVIAGDYISSVSREWHGLPYIDYLGNTYTSSQLTCQLASPTGYTVSFDGWYDSSDSKVSSDQTYTVSNLTSNITLTAKATAAALPTYTVTYRPGTDGAGTVQTDTKVENTALTLKGAIFTRSGYEQNGWSTSDGGSKAYDLGAQYTADADVTLYPFWTATVSYYTVTYRPGANGTGTVQTDQKTSGVPLTLKGAIFTRNGYTQSGWATTDGGAIEYPLNGQYTDNADITLYPYWKSNSPDPEPHPTQNAAVEHAKRTSDYLKQLRTPFVKLCRLRFLQPDGSTAFAIDNNPLNRRSGTFIQDGNISGNLQNGQRRTASVTLSNVDAEYDYNVNNVWFGQQIAIDEGLILSDGSEYYIPQGIFYIQDPQETLNPNLRTMTYPLVDKWSYLDGTLFGRLEATYEVPVGTNIFEPIASLLSIDKGNGYKVDNVPPIFTEYYNEKTQVLPNGETVSLAVSPYTMRVDSDDGTYADVVLGMSEMVNAWVGYDNTGTLRVEPSQDDIVDTNKPVLWRFSLSEAQLIGTTYTVKNTEVFNDYIVLGEKTDDSPQAAGRAQNLDPSSDTNVNIIGRKTYRETASGYYTETQCRDLAEWKLKRATVLQKAVSISCIQMMHIFENSLVEIVRTDKPGSPVERHLIQGYTRPLTSNGTMTINAVSVADFPIATITNWPE